MSFTRLKHITIIQIDYGIAAYIFWLRIIATLLITTMTMLYCETLASPLIVASEFNCHGRLSFFDSPCLRYFVVYLAL